VDLPVVGGESKHSIETGDTNSRNKSVIHKSNTSEKHTRKSKASPFYNTVVDSPGGSLLDKNNTSGTKQKYVVKNQPTDVSNKNLIKSRLSNSKSNSRSKSNGTPNSGSGSDYTGSEETSDSKTSYI